MNYKNYCAYKKNVDNYHEKKKEEKKEEAFMHPFHAVFDVSQDICLTEEKISECYNKYFDTEERE